MLGKNAYVTSAFFNNEDEIIKKIKELNQLARIFVIFSFFVVLGLAIIIPLCATKIIPWGYTFGYLLGSVIMAISLLFINYSFTLITNANSTRKALLAVLISFVRLALYIVGLLFAVLCEYFWDKANILCVFGVFFAYLPTQIVVVINYWLGKK